MKKKCVREEVFRSHEEKEEEPQEESSSCCSTYGVGILVASVFEPESSG